MGEMSASVAGPSFTSTELAKRTLQRRAVEAAIWGMPLVSADAMRQAFFRDAGAKYGDILYLSEPADWRFQTTTPNASSLYVYFNFNLKDGPVVLEVPPALEAGLFGTLLDAWEMPLTDVGQDTEDRSKGVRYLLLFPDHNQSIPEGYRPVWSCTLNGCGLFRAIPAGASPEDRQKTVDLIRKMRMYPFSQSANPPAQRHVDIAGTLFDGIVKFDDTFYDSLARIVNEEPVQVRDYVVMAQLRSLGIEKGKVFKPDRATRDLLKNAVAETHAIFMNAATIGQPYWPSSQWLLSMGIGPTTGFSYETGDRLDIDERGMRFFLAHASPNKLSAATFCLGAFRDASSLPLQGDQPYMLRIPAGVPVKQSWTVTVYDLATAAFTRDSPRIAIDSYDSGVQRNDDGSIDIHFGPASPNGQDTNWLYTAPRKPWFAFFRFHGPETPVLDRSWVLPNIERAR